MHSYSIYAMIQRIFIIIMNSDTLRMHYIHFADPTGWLKLRGTFALPMSTAGCPIGLSSDGYILQDTYNFFRVNSWSNGIAKRLQVSVHSDYIITQYCVKSSVMNDDDTNPWPTGSYCIGRRDEECPDGFNEGFIKWDDKNINNRNQHYGELPDGEYGRNTKVFYCCRSDGPSTKPVKLPTDMPFVLYRYGGKCQQVEGMRVQQDYIQWINEGIIWNSDSSGGRHPDNDGGNMNHKIFYCYYTN